MKILTVLAPWWNAFLNLLYPTICRCIVCERALPDEYLQRMNITEIPESRLWLCDICQKQVQPIIDHDCVICGRANASFAKIKTGDPNTVDSNTIHSNSIHPNSIHPNTVGPICKECHMHERPFVFARAAVRYTGIAKDLIRILKFESNLEAAVWLGEWLGQAWTRCYAEFPFNYIVPVPLHPDRLHKRGFNQAYLLAEKLSEISNLPILEPLQRIHTRSSQVSRNKVERLQSLEGAFQCNPDLQDSIVGANILLVDDVFTTGATVEACTIELLKSGCTGVWVLTVAR